MGNRRRAGFENPSNLCKVLQVVHWPLVGFWFDKPQTQMLEYLFDDFFVFNKTDENRTLMTDLSSD